MASTTTHDLYRRWLDELWNGDPRVASELVTEDFIGHWPDGDVHGAKELASKIGETQQMFTSLGFTLEVGPIVEGELVSARWLGRGRTSDGEMSFIGNDILRVSGGRFVEYWVASLPIS